MRVYTSVLTGVCFLAMGAVLGQTSEESVKMKDLPPAVQATVQQQSKGATLVGLSKEIEDGKTFYEAEMKVNGHGKDVLIDSAGKVVEVEEEIALTALPAAAKSAIEKAAAQGRISKLESVAKDKDLTYEALIESKGKTSEVKVTPDGKVVTQKEEEKEEEDK